MSKVGLTLATLSLLVVPACAAERPLASVPSAAPLSAAPLPAPAAPAPSAPEPAARDPKIVALATPALACAYEDEDFERDCPALKAWLDDEALFADGKGNETLVAMLGDPDPKVRTLAELRGIDEPSAFFGDKNHARSLFSLAARRTDAGRPLASYVAVVDAEKLGLGSELVALAKHPSKNFRSGLTGVITKSQSPSAVATIEALLEDADPKVQEDAVGALGGGGMTPPVDAVCGLLTRQLDKPGRIGSAALWAGSSSRCPGMHERVVAELEKRVADPAKVTNASGVHFSLAARGVCSRTKSAELKRKGFAIGTKLVDGKVPDPNTRRAAIDVLVDCDRVAATPILRGLVSDKTKSVAEGARKAQADLAAKRK